MWECADADVKHEAIDPQDVSQVEDLLDVSGIGESKLAAIRDAVVVP